jgi:hypothetical protein
MRIKIALTANWLQVAALIVRMKSLKDQSKARATSTNNAACAAIKAVFDVDARATEVKRA